MINKSLKSDLQYNKIIKSSLIILILLNLIDAFATLYWVSNGIALEANPIMETLLTIGPIPFLFIKLFLVFCGCWLFWIHRKHNLTKISIFILLFVYIFVIIKHVNILIEIL